LYSEETHVVIRSGVKTMLRTAYRILGGRARPNARLRIASGPANIVQDDPDEVETDEVEPNGAP
jgi:hypothetical protein